MKSILTVIFLTLICFPNFAQDKKERVKREIGDDMYGVKKTKPIANDTLKTTALQEGTRHFNPNEEGQIMYAQLVGTQKFLSSKVTVEIDFGQERSWINLSDKNRIIDPKTKKPFVFNSMVDAMNYMGSLGWQFLQAYVVTIGDQNVYHWLLSKEIDADISNDLPATKRDLKK